MSEEKERTIATFYKFADLPDCEEWKNRLEETGDQNDILGTIILAPEGINGTISGSSHGIKGFINEIKSDSRFADIQPRCNQSRGNTFYRLRIIVRPEIVTLGDPSINPNKGVGEYIDPDQWNDLIRDPEVTLIDTRNDYEVEIGTFEGAENPKTQTFRQWSDYVSQNLDPQKHKKVAMFCTGGIRCEKASAHLLSHGFEEVFHLKGGILNYLEKIPSEESSWNGECFILITGSSVTHGLEDGNAKLCFGCRWPLKEEDLQSPKFEEGVSCPKCFDELKEEKKEGLRERQKQMQIAEKRKVKHIGLKMPNA